MGKLNIKDFDQAYRDLSLAQRLTPNNLEIDYEIGIITWKVFGQYEFAHFIFNEVIQ